MDYDDIDIKTIVERKPSGSMSLRDVEEGREDAPFEVAIDRRTVPLGDAPLPGPQLVLELWTRNRIYLVDSNLVCSQVIDRETHQIDPRHRMLGAHLVGGQRRYGKTFHQVKPFPIVGSEAVFAPRAAPGTFNVTSRVDRVVMHVTVTTMLLDEQNAFDDVTNALLLANAQPIDD
jgi:hypothetical protein